MPLYKTITVNPDTTVYIWKIEESEETLKQGVTLSDACLKRINSMKSEIHRRGFISIRHLLKEAGYQPSDLYYDELGKPHLTDNKYISITHSFSFTAIIVSTNPVGIDIEKQRDKIVKIAHKFTTFRSYKSLANFEALVRKLTIIWCTKESLYKLYAQPGLSFLQHIDIQDFEFNDGKTTGHIIYKGKLTKYKLHFLEFDGYTCAYGYPQ